ncbi:hypothetical protein NSZ01_05410 [Nocardioides szechwanensis]|uniref:Uncharacterized protein n=1 Tax=Nocardioides szechwanensis TaxID=1005944 RepID=A0A1G9W2C5_9ACTN|nr:hypothetical protein [Nocardioides szechwanensis]GEP32773.1 hypothetical protein NSZ01_05410 [Nocardioides szechwanensis]SDM78341.1 hypothetical protein SAMN05192576_0921 [Nocardioides szechwanensis]
MTRSITLSAATAAAFLLTSAFSGAVAAEPGGRDSDQDGIPNRWERVHGMNPHSAADARKDFDHDRLSNLAEYRLRTQIRDEDTDNDGADDGDEVKDGLRGTRVRDRDTDDDGTTDGDEDADHDGLDNEDEDDSSESCVADDDDSDDDSVADEDENEHGASSHDSDSDDDGVADGDEDSDEDGEADEDEDDAAVDDCVVDSDDDGEGDEDEGDVLGTITSFDSLTGVLVIAAAAGFDVTGTVTDDTEITFEDVEDVEDGGEVSRSDSDAPGTVEDLQAGVVVADVEFEDDGVELDNVEIYAPAS